MKTTNLTCDRCKATETIKSSNESKLDLREVGVVVNRGNYSMGYQVPVANVETKQEWCITCRKKFHLDTMTEEEQKTYPKPSLEEQLIEILKQFVQAHAPSNE